MTGNNDALDALRREIDEIDTKLHGLLMRRAEVVENVGRAKGRTNTAVFAPGREAMVLRKLLARHEGLFPRQSVLRIWREMIPAYASMQAPLPVVVYASQDNQRCWDLARDHFGSHVPMTCSDDAAAIIERVSSGRDAVGVLPTPATGDDSWWRLLCDKDRPCVVSSLPFALGSNAKSGAGDAYAIACVTPDSSGDDRSLVCFTANDNAAAIAALATAGFAGQCLASDGDAHYLAEVDGFLTVADDRLAALADACLIGVYAAPAGDILVEDS
ncbi:MAG: chorismate mutase [Rhodospirillaceae bacterium]|jgi:chorismate mutase-like protein|nr:chorismate mutase [Rhodospirillaceae bacterium]MBT5666410.1 chorismate mutase [Rhodospirillaceae bacterium]MBT5811270.1 chorismate mutase [Rhodospirillaceae bacterium]